MQIDLKPARYYFLRMIWLAGSTAYDQDQRRAVPLCYRVENRRAWYEGWDAACIMHLMAEGITRNDPLVADLPNIRKRLPLKY